MAYDRLLIAPIGEGIRTDLKPWLISDDAWADMNNAYVFRGRVRKRFGSRYSGAGWSTSSAAPLYSRLSINIGTTNAVTGNIAGTVPGNIFAVGQMFSIGNYVYTVKTAGVAQTMLRNDGNVGACTYSTTNGNYVINNAPKNTAVFFYTNQPVMGITYFQQGPINDQPTWAFDTQFAYNYDGSRWEQDGIALFHGNDSQFFWAANWTGIASSDPVLFVTNFNATQDAVPGAHDDPIWNYDGANWAIFKPHFLPGGGAPNAGPYVNSARIVIPFQNRLLLLNTIEFENADNIHYPSRCRFSWYGNPGAANAWYEPNQTDNAGGFAAGGGWIDATTSEEIISAEFIKDRLIVYFERSTWELAYTGNQIVPFQWVRLNTELGADATFSTVPFDREVIAVGNTGIHSCNGSNVTRIDDKIPTTIFSARSKNSGRKRVAGIRDYYDELIYWTYPSPDAGPYANTYPDQILVYNYKNQTWAFNDDSVTCWGYFENAASLTWANAYMPWQNANFPWNAGPQRTDFRQIIAGNQQGYIFIVDSGVTRNAGVLQITDITVAGGFVTQITVLNHNIPSPSFIKVEYATGLLELNGINIQVYATDVNTLKLVTPIATAGVYTGNGVIGRVSNVNFTSKQFNPYVEKGMNTQLAMIDFLVDSTSAGQINVEYYANTSELGLGQEAIDNDSSYGPNNMILETAPYFAFYPLEYVQERLWHTLYLQGDGECVQLYFYMSNQQMGTVSIAEAPFSLHAMIIHTKPTSVRLQSY